MDEKIEKPRLAPGIAPIKPSFLLDSKERDIDWEHVPDGDQNKRKNEDSTSYYDRNDSKKIKLRGQNKNKYRFNKRARGRSNRGGSRDDKDESVDPVKTPVDRSLKLCLRYLETDGVCPYKEKCNYSHDCFKIVTSGNNYKPIGDGCYTYSTYGRCPYSFVCKFNQSHVKLNEDKKLIFNLVDHRRWSIEGGSILYKNRERNRLDMGIQFELRKKKYDFKLSDAAILAFCAADHKPIPDSNISEKNSQQDPNTDINVTKNEEEKRIGAALVDDFLGGRDFQKKRIDFSEKLCLAPLTTVGNMPFRRVCKKFSCDVTCSEMSLASTLMTGALSEWSHLRRHKSEDIFGIQICGQHPEVMTKTAQLLSEQCDYDFIDINCGCPTDYIYMSGAGAGLMLRPSKLRKIIAGCAMVSTVPVTIKMRAGATEDKNIAHNIVKSVINPFGQQHIGSICIHGRSRAQRYTKLADWSYVNECANMTDIPLMGSGDCLSYEEYYANLEKYPKLSGVMIARGALIKPWIFTEIKERRTWDITSQERLGIVKDFVNFGLDHWGSDSQGAETTRRFLLEWLSFAYRYIPVGLLEVLPQKINQRPPLYRGRDDMETMLSSPSCSDWIKISEIFLGKVPDDFQFFPKHKANAYVSDQPEKVEQ